MNRPIELAVTWLPNCASSLDEAFFSVRIKSDGSAEFAGARQARTLGTVELTIDAAQARAIGDAASVALSKSSKRTKSTESSALQDAALCMDVTKGNSPTAVTGRISVQSAAGGRFLDEVAKVVPLRSLVCPTRREGEFAILRYQDLCVRWYLAPAITAVYLEPTCQGAHTILVYDDGTIYYNAHVTENVGGRQIDRTIGEQYIELSAAELRDLFGLVATFDFKHSYFPNSATDEEAKRRRTNHPLSMQRFKTAITSERRIKFVAIPPHAGPCPAREEVLKLDAARLYVRWGLNLSSGSP